MLWYFDLLGMAVFCVIGTILLTLQKKEGREAVVMTKDGYPVTIPQMLELEKKRTFNNNELEVLARNMFTSRGDFISIGLIVSLLGYVIVGNILELLFPLFQNGVVGIGFMAFMLATFYFESEKSFKESVVFIGKMSIESPEEFKHYGKYAKNPFDVHDTMRQLMKHEEDWEKTQTLRDNQKRKVEEIVKDSTSNGSEWLEYQYQKETLEHHEKHLHKLGGEMTLKAGLLSKNLLTDNPSKAIKSIVDAKVLAEQSAAEETPPESSLEEISEALLEPTKPVPHYIEVMKEIVLNPNLPKEVTDEAQALVDAYEKNEENQERQREIDNALLEIQTVKQYMV